MNSIENNKSVLFNRITKYLKNIYQLEVYVFLLKAFGLVGLLFLILSFFESIWFFGSSTRLILIISLIIVFAILLFYGLNSLINFIKIPSTKEINKGAQEIGNYFPDLKDSLLNSIQILSDDSSNDSKSLTDAAFNNVYKKVEKVNFQEVVDYSRVRSYLKYFLLICATMLSFNILDHNISNATFRLLNFNSEFAKPAEFTLSAFPGNIDVKKNENVEIIFSASGNPPKNLSILTKSVLQPDYISHTISRDSNDNYTLLIRNIKNSFSYYAEENNVASDTYKISVSSLPQIRSLTAELIPPAYSKLPKISNENNGNLAALAGTRINFKIDANKDLVNAVMVINDSTEKHFQINNSRAEGIYNVTSKVEYFFEITDSNGNRNESPIKYVLEIIPDNYPEIEITNPELNSLLPQNDLVSVNYNIKDDFGFSKCELNYSISQGNETEENNSFKKINLQIDKSGLEQSLFHNWDISKLFLKENNIVTFYIEVFDNDNISGPKYTKSNTLKIRVPSLNELFAEIDKSQDSAVEELTKTLDEAVNLKNELEQINNELKQNEKKINWNEKERIEQALNKFEKITEQMEDVKEQINQMQDKMTQNNLLSEETMKKYSELQDLLDDLTSDEMKKALEEMQNSLKDLMRDQVQNSLENLKMNETAFQKSIERTLNLLKRIQIEQKLDEVIKRTENIVEKLDDLKKNTENKNNSDAKSNELADEQKSLEKKMDDLKEEMEKLSDKMKGVEDMPQQELEDINQKFDEQNNNELSEEALKNLMEKNFDKALQNQNKLSQNMNSMKKDLQQMQQQMQQQNQSAMMQKMLKSIDNIIDLSKAQEKLINRSENSLQLNDELSDIVKNQMENQQNLDNVLKELEKLSQKTFAISPEMGKALGDAKRNMNEALAGLQNKNGSAASKGQGQAMSSLNEAAAIMQNSLQNMMQNGGGGSGGMMSLMQQLQQMAQQQMGINQMTQSMKGQLSLQQQAQMQRLSKEQGNLQKSLEQLNKEARESGESKKIASNLESVLNDMKEVISGLNTKKIDDDLVKKQEKILSKLLDAQRSINERDFEEKRESLEGKRFDLNSPDKLDLTKQQAQDILREELLKAVKEGYSKDYQDLIRRYFESLNNSGKQN